MANPPLRGDKPSGGGPIASNAGPVVANPPLRWGKPSGGGRIACNAGPVVANPPLRGDKPSGGGKCPFRIVPLRSVFAEFRSISVPSFASFLAFSCHSLPVCFKTAFAGVPVSCPPTYPGRTTLRMADVVDLNRSTQTTCTDSRIARAGKVSGKLRFLYCSRFEMARLNRNPKRQRGNDLERPGEMSRVAGA